VLDRAQGTRGEVLEMPEAIDLGKRLFGTLLREQ